MLVKTYGSAVFGVDALTITIEVNINHQGKTDIILVGLPDNAVKESMQRMESAIKEHGFSMPRTRLIVNLAPADIRKSGTAFDLPIAIGMLAASEQLENADVLSEYVIMGELGLDGEIRPVKGALPMAIRARAERFTSIILPASNAPEAALVDGIHVYGAHTLMDVIRHINQEQLLTPLRTDLNALAAAAQPLCDVDFSDVRGQENIKRAMEIAAAGSHNLILIGPPGAGKTMLARRLPTILPPMQMEEALETTKIYSVAGKLPENTTLIAQRPYRAPHHSISNSGLVGGGSIPQPGEISLAHHGVLFLDELPEFQRSVLEVLRQPMEERRVTISRARMAVDFPANFMLVASMNPCPCGFFNHPEKNCSCVPVAVQRYLNKISGPLLDRIDLHVEVTPVAFTDLSQAASGETSAVIRHRVVEARNKQAQRFAEHPHVYANAQMPSKLLRTICELDATSASLLKTAMHRLNLSARAYDRILKVSRTIADLDGSEQIQPAHVAEAIQYRSLDRQGWGG